MTVCKFADVSCELHHSYDYIAKLTKKYITDEKPSIRIAPTKEELESELLRDPDMPMKYHESAAIYRKLCTEMIDYDTFVFHSSALMYEDKAYIFTAPSGTGKSTHASLWMQKFKDKVTIINDDKPLIKKTLDGFYAYGTPWSGKSSLNTNTRAKIQGICILYQAKENCIERLSYDKALIPLLNQTIHFEDEKRENKLLDLIDGLISCVPVYRMGCNISLDAALLSYNTMKGM